MAVVLGENGVLSMGNKTPVTILQETLQRQGINPQYELIYNGVGTLDPVFKYQVSALGLSAIGDGKSKKEAKHDAAKALLIRMQADKIVTENAQVYVDEETDIASPYTGALKENFVGKLDEVCVTNRIPLSVFVPIREVGPPHARIFTMQCKVSTCTETAVSRTKKQAKHMAAQMMIKRVANILGEKFIPLPETPQDTEEPEELPNLRAIERGTFRHDLSALIADSHNVFYHKTEEFVLPKMFHELYTRPEEFYEQLENPKEFLDELLLSLEGTCKVVPITPSVFKDTLEEIEKEWQLYWWGDEESSDEEEDDVDSSDSDKSYIGKYVLEELDLGNLGEEPAESSNTQPTKDSDLTPKGESSETNVELTDSNVEVLPAVTKEWHINCDIIDNIPIKYSNPIFLSVECPQGTWCFRGYGESLDESVKRAAVEALKFLRIMALPPDP